MRKLLFRICYDGTSYHGWQVQPNGISVQETIQDALEKLFLKREPICGCSRTDAGVHANEYFFHMVTENQMDTDKIDMHLTVAFFQRI